MNSKLGILLYPDAQPMDVIGPWEVFATWKNTLNAPLNMFLVAENLGPIICDNGITLNPHIDFSQCPSLDYLIIPGGRGRLTQINNQALLHFIQKQAAQAKYIISVCTGAFLLYESGVVEDQALTTYWRALPELHALNNIQVKETRIVKSGKIWASGGVSSGVDLAFAVIADIAGEEMAGKVQLLFEYFPETKLYASLDTMNTLPPYYNEKYPPHLAEYIVQYLNKHTKK